MRAILTALLLVLVTGCQNWQGAEPPPVSGWLAWAAPAGFGRQQQFSLLWQARTRQGTIEVPLALSISAGGISLVGFSPIGGALFSASLANGKVTSSGGRVLPPPLRPADLLQEIQLALWPLARMRPLLLQRDLVLTEDADGRSLLRAGQPFIRIGLRHPDRVGGIIQFEQQELHYRWSVTILSVENLESNEK